MFFIVDAERLKDLRKFDTVAETEEQARAAAVEMAQSTGIPCHILSIVATAVPDLTVKWST